MLYRISVAERGLTGIANIFRSRLSRLDDLLRAGTVPLTLAPLGAQTCGFSQIAPEVLGISLRNLPYISGQQFHTMCQKIRTQVIIGQP